MTLTSASYIITFIPLKGPSMRDYLLDLVEHTFDLGCIDTIKITGTDKATSIDSIADDKSVVLQGEFAVQISEFQGLFGMPNLAKLKILLNLQEYREDAEITVKHQNRNDQTVPVGLHFKNATGDFQNDYRFMTSEIITEKLKTAKFKGVKWNIEIRPTVAGIQRLRMQAQANAEESNFRVTVRDNNLTFMFGDHSTHAGEFVFHAGVDGSMQQPWAWPVQKVISILGLTGDKIMRISDEGAMEITVDSGIAIYRYLLPAQSK